MSNLKSANAPQPGEDEKELIEKNLKLNPKSEILSLDDIVSFTVKYPEKYVNAKGGPKQKHHNDGDILRLHNVTAMQFQNELKIGKITS